MVRFEEDRYIIEIITGVNPMEDWVRLVEHLSLLLSMSEEAELRDVWMVPLLITSLMPDADKYKIVPKGG